MLHQRCECSQTTLFTESSTQIKHKSNSTAVAELADAQDLKSCVLTDVRVQVPPRVLRFLRPQTLFGPSTKKSTPIRFGVGSVFVLDLCRWFFPPSMERIQPWHTSKQETVGICLLYTSPSPRDLSTSRMPSSA